MRCGCALAVEGLGVKWVLIEIRVDELTPQGVLLRRNRTRMRLRMRLKLRFNLTRIGINGEHN